MTIGFTERKENSILYFKIEGGRPIMLLLYVDDLLLTEKRNSLKLASKFEMKELDMMHYFLGMEVC